MDRMPEKCAAEDPVQRHTGASDYLVVRNLVKGFGAAAVVGGVSFTIQKGQMVTLLGPSGCGKTTTLRCIAGLETLTAGEIFIDGELVSSREKNLFLPPERRNIGMVFQSYAVWPHMTVWGNVAYPLQVRGVAKTQTQQRVGRILEMIGLTEMAQRNVTRLSGGQQQRVAVARALVHNPRVLLLDEPLSNLDARLRESMRFEIRRVQQELNITALYVTHDQAEAMALSDQVIVMNQGAIEQVGRPMDIYRFPRSAFVARFFGAVNLIRGTVAAAAADTPMGRVAVRTSEGQRLVSSRLQPGMKASDPVWICIRPQDVELCVPVGSQEIANTLPGRISRVVQMGSYVEYEIEAIDMKLSCQSARDLQHSIGACVAVTLRPERCICVV